MKTLTKAHLATTGISTKLKAGISHEITICFCFTAHNRMSYKCHVLSFLQNVAAEVSNHWKTKIYNMADTDLRMVCVCYHCFLNTLHLFTRKGQICQKWQKSQRKFLCLK